MLVAFGALISLYFMAQCSWIFLYNYSLNEQRPARIDRWEVQEEASDQYGLAAHFSFEIAGRSFHGITRFAEPVFLNPDSAIAAVKEKVAHPQSSTVWYNRTDPSRASLVKTALRGKLFRAVLAGAVAIYFILLGKNGLSVKSVPPLNDRF